MQVNIITLFTICCCFFDGLILISLIIRTTCSCGMNTVRHALVYTKCTRIEWDSFRDFTQMIDASLRFPPPPPFLLPVPGSPMAFPVAGGEGFAPIQMIFSLVLVFFLSLFPFSPFSLLLLPRRKVGIFLPPSSISATPLLAGQHLSSPASHLPLRPPRKWSWFEGLRSEDQKSWGRDRSSVSTSPSPVEINYEAASDRIFRGSASGEEEFDFFTVVASGWSGYPQVGGWWWCTPLLGFIV